MSADRTPGVRRRREVVNIHSKYLVVAHAVPQQIAAGILSGDSLSAGLVHGYRRELLGLRRFTQITTPEGAVSYEMREPGQGLLDGFDNPPRGVSADVETKWEIGQGEFESEFAGTTGRRAGKDRHTVQYSTAPGWPEHPAAIDVYRAGLEGEVEGMQELAGRMIVIVSFSNLRAAESFQHPEIRPPWMGENVTKPFSTKKLVQQLAGEDERSLAPYYLEHSASVADLRR